VTLFTDHTKITCYSLTT